ncbi:MAG: alanine--tRNA ligase [Candidatus Paceibacterota bacterium]
MQSYEIRKRFLDFFEKRGHALIPSAPLVPENDPSVLFNTAGMQPLVPYLLGKEHPQGKRLANYQKCVRTGDIEEIGDNTHLTFFEMLGNWSLGDYFKKEAITWSYELLTSKTEGFGLDVSRLYVTVFEGNNDAPRDEEAKDIWLSLGIPEHRIYFMPAKSNWWSAGDNGPCGPDSEMFYDVTLEGLGDLSHEEFMQADESQRVVEIWNDVFMQYLKKDGVVVSELEHKNIDTGSGFERLVMVLQQKSSVFDTDIFAPIFSVIDTHKTTQSAKSERVVADHIRASAFLIGDGVVPSNTDQGYVLRRLLRRAIRHSDSLGCPRESIVDVAQAVIKNYKDVYENLLDKKDKIISCITEEESKFRKTLLEGNKKLEKLLKEKIISGEDAFQLFASYGFPFELTLEIAREKGAAVEEDAFYQELEKHQELSRTASAGKFKGGLADADNPQVLKYHTATHLLHQALRDVLGSHVTQKGSNITPERLRFDFTHDKKMTDEEKAKVEAIVNEKIKAQLPMQSVVLPKEEAEKTGALHFFGDKYGDDVSVYFIGDSLETAYSKEFCGGPHVENTKDLGIFSIKKEEASSAGVRRIKAVLS